MLPDNELARLAEDIKAKGQILPITLYEGKILDGRNRYRACEMAGITPITKDYTGDDPLGLIASLNDHRRHDTENERALVGARMANLKKGVRSDTSMDVSVPAITQERAAELSGSSIASIQRAKAIVQGGIPELQDMAESGEISIRAASEVAKLPEEEQRKAVLGGITGVKEAAKKASEKPKKEKQTSLPVIEKQSTNGKKIIMRIGMQIFYSAELVMQRLDPIDEEFDQCLDAMIQYCQNRKENKK